MEKSTYADNSKTEKEVQRLVLTLKDQLRDRGIYYQDLCKTLKLSEASIKRLFSKKSFDLNQISKICDFIGITFHELSTLSFENWSRYHLYTPEQDSLLGQNPVDMYVFVRLLVGYKPDDVKKELDLSQAQMFKILNRLEKAKVLTFLPKGQVKMLIQGPFRSIHNGFYESVFLPRLYKIVFEHFLKSAPQYKKFRGLLHVREFYLTREVFEKFKQEVEELSLKYRQINNWQIRQNRPQDLVPVAGLFCLDMYNAFKENISFRDR